MKFRVEISYFSVSRLGSNNSKHIHPATSIAFCIWSISSNVSFFRTQIFCGLFKRLIMRSTVFLLLIALNSPSYSDVLPCRIILSYYWPVSNYDEANLYKLEMDSPNLIDILQSESHGSNKLREYWRSKGKHLVSRVYPFRHSMDIATNLAYFESAVGPDNLLSIDEFVGHKWGEDKTGKFLDLLYRFKQKNPDVLLLLWDATDWSTVDHKYLRSIMDVVDLIVFQRYVKNYQTTKKNYINSIMQTLDFIDGVNISEDQVLVGIGVDPRYIKNLSSTDSIGEYLADASTLLMQSDIRGVGIYAPVYLSNEILRSLDKIFVEYRLAEC